MTQITCFECKLTKESSESKKIVFLDPTFRFNQDIDITNFNNFFVCDSCLSTKDIIAAEVSRFAVGILKYPIGNSMIGCEFPRLKEMKYFSRVSEEWIKKHLQGIYNYLVRCG
jgi:hypothetical protein